MPSVSMMENFKAEVIPETCPMCNILEVLCNMLSLVTVSKVLFSFDDLILLWRKWLGVELYSTGKLLQIFSSIEELNE